MKFRFKQVLFLFSCIALITAGLTGCFSPWTDTGNITINVGSGSQPAGRHFFITDEELSGFEHIITLRGPGGTITKTLNRGETSVSINVMPGKWTVDVRAIGDRTEEFDEFNDFYNEQKTPLFPARMLRALAIEQDVEVKAGATANVPLMMTKATSVESRPQLVYVLEQAYYYYGEEIILLNGNIEMSDGTNPSPIFIGFSSIEMELINNITFMADKDVAIKRGAYNFDDLIKVSIYSTLTLGKPGMTGTITIDGSKDKSEGEITYAYPLIRVEDGNLIINNGIILTNNNSENGGAVYLNATEEYRTTFTMNGGYITNNEAYVNGGGVYATGPVVFGMSGNAEISGNSANFAGAGVFITDGVQLEMNGGIIRNNTITSTDSRGGGGVYVSGLYAGVRDSINTKLHMEGTAVISDNSVVRYGGGVYIESGGILNVDGGTISNNSASDLDGCGGGVYVDDSGIFYMNGGVIKSNYAEFRGSGLYIKDGYFYKEGGGIIYGANEGGNTNLIGKESNYNAICYEHESDGIPEIIGRNRTVPANEDLAIYTMNDTSWTD